MKKLVLSFFSLGLVLGVNAQNISLTSPTQLISENFDGLGTSGTALSTLPNGWWIAENPGNTTYRAGDGSTNNGDTYSFGTGTTTDRALGGVASASVIPNFGARIVNNTGSTITQFSYDLFMEQWRSGGRTGLDSLYFSYGVNNTATGVWTRVLSNDLVSKVTQGTAAALDGNAAANRAFYSFTVTGLSWAAGDTLFLKWSDPNVGGSDDGLAIDNFNFTISGVLPVKYNALTATSTDNGNLVKWSTASEKNNSHFNVERSVNGSEYEVIGLVKGVGNTNKVSNYSFIDVNAVKGTSCYRLSQVDFDGKSELSKSVCVTTEKDKASAVSTTPNPFNDRITIAYNTVNLSAVTFEVIDMIGKVHYSATEQVKGDHAFTVNTSTLPQGVYFVRVTNGNEVKTQRIIKK